MLLRLVIVKNEYKYASLIRNAVIYNVCRNNYYHILNQGMLSPCAT